MRPFLLDGLPSRVIREELLRAAPWAIPLCAPWSITDSPPTLAFAALKVVEAFD
jgi:hypothetical protein